MAAQTLMTFAGNFFTEEMERQSLYNVVQIVVKTMTREPRQRYLKVKCTVPNKIDGRITVGMNGFIGSRCYAFVQTDIFLSFVQGYNDYSLSINTDKTNLLSWN